jgi:hypothetical protein
MEQVKKNKAVFKVLRGLFLWDQDGNYIKENQGQF